MGPPLGCSSLRHSAPPWPRSSSRAEAKVLEVLADVQGKATRGAPPLPCRYWCPARRRAVSCGYWRSARSRAVLALDRAEPPSLLVWIDARTSPCGIVRARAKLYLHLKTEPTSIWSHGLTRRHRPAGSSLRGRGRKIESQGERHDAGGGQCDRSAEGS